MAGGPCVNLCFQVLSDRYQPSYDEFRKRFFLRSATQGHPATCPYSAFDAEPSTLAIEIRDE